MRFCATGTAAALTILLCLLLVPHRASADDFFKLSPGKLSKAHGELDNHDDCTKCHELGQGVKNLLCLDCHEHRGLRDAIRAKRGLHATFKQECRVCHTEHKGRDFYIVDWKQVGGRRSFDHDKTGFVLKGLHDEVQCTSCHKKKLKSGRTSYAALPRTCNGCHKNPHQFTAKANDLADNCDSCHGKGGTAKKMKPKDLPFDHGKRTGLALEGQHGKANCVDCHKNAVMSMKRGARTCNNCHKSPHGKAFAKSECTKCHSVKLAWKKSEFDHATTGFPLQAKHNTKKCGNCHKSAKAKPKSECSSCHKDPHRKRFTGLSCKTCHGLGGTKKSFTFKHERKTKFPLTAGHAKLGCRSCHRGRGPRKFEKFEGPDCMSCHAHKNVHGGQFKDTPCMKCHREGGSSDVAKFDHDKDARFALTGFHQELEDKGNCKACHPSDAFRTGKTACVDCHEDSHKGQLGTECQQCHAAEVHFKETAKAFDHNRKTQFVLEAKHAEVACEKCHPDRTYKTGKSTCFDCHAGDDPHDDMLGQDCERCHIPDKGAPKFKHDTMTAFTLTGVHLTTKCGNCHRESFPDGVPPKVGWTQAFVIVPIDQGFPTPGTECAECHHDPHDGSYGKACDSCHDTDGFGSANAAVHDTGAFRLMGTHDRIRCERCHEPQRPITGLGVVCQECHRNDDYHNNSLGPFCGRCHSQFDWSPPRFNHSSLGIVLVGSHKTADCRDCHGVGNYVGTPTDCQVCHAPEAAQVPDPVHVSPEFDDCNLCHTQAAFVPARRYHPWWPLEGTHTTISCRNCHQQGYVGTPRECVGCHEGNYLSTTNPNHMAAGFGRDCERCHNTISFEVARYQHQTFIARGAHVVADCERCHVGGNYDGAFGGMVTEFVCESCHGTGGPVEDRPADHDQLGYPTSCELCHNQLGWLPAKRPR